mmetsp:Transcript_2567/g.3904  ORF Transcript_2567/g.3904 Transcript_2567/m.3904 type:complete len:345 (+) Transcript_2567:509-1543(+)
MEYRWTDEYAQKADLGDQKSIFLMANFHLVGYGNAERSRHRAISWLMKASKSYKSAQELLSRMVSDEELQTIRRFYEMIETPRLIDEALELASSQHVDHYLRSAEAISLIGTLPLERKEEDSNIDQHQQQHQRKRISPVLQYFSLLYQRVNSENEASETGATSMIEEASHSTDSSSASSPSKTMMKLPPSVMNAAESLIWTKLMLEGGGVKGLERVRQAVGEDSASSLSFFLTPSKALGDYLRSVDISLSMAVYKKGGLYRDMQRAFVQMAATEENDEQAQKILSDMFHHNKRDGEENTDIAEEEALDAQRLVNELADSSPDQASRLAQIFAQVLNERDRQRQL